MSKILNTTFWKMTQGKIVEGVFAINKPPGITSAQALRELQEKFNKSKLFAPWIQSAETTRAREKHNQRGRRKEKKIQVKIGHGGTLDPMATGVLIAGVGKGTKVLTSFLECTKTYETVVLFGGATDSYDRTGKILKRGPYDHLTKQMAEQALGAFRGKIMQRPPIYSALKMNGKPLYEYAREGKEIPREIVKRPVEVVELELVEWMEGGTHDHKLPTEEASDAEKKVGDAFQTNNMEEITGKKQPEAQPNAGSSIPKRKMEDADDDLVSDRPTKKTDAIKEDSPPMMSGGLQAIPRAPPAKGPPAAKFRLTVTSGFYVRSFAFDLGQALGSQAVMAELVRTRQGKFELGKNAMEWEVFDKGEDVWGPGVEGQLVDWSETYKPFSDEKHLEPVGKSIKKEEPSNSMSIKKEEPSNSMINETADQAAAFDDNSIKKEEPSHSMIDETADQATAFDDSHLP